RCSECWDRQAWPGAHDRKDGWVWRARAAPHSYREDMRSQIASQKAIKLDGLVPAGRHLYTILHAAEAGLAPLCRRRAKLGHGLAMSCNDDGLTAFGRTDEFGQPIFRIRYTDVH